MAPFLLLFLLLLLGHRAASQCSPNATHFLLEGPAAKKALAAAFFKPCPKLQSLVALDLPLQELQADFLQPIPSLRSLDIVDAPELRSFAAGCLQPVPRLSTLSVKRSGLREISTASLKPCAAITRLHIEGCPLQQLQPRSLVACGHSLKSLELRGGELTIIKRAALSGLSRLIGLSLERNKIVEIAPGSFNDLVDLRRLRLGRNELATLASGTFRGLTALESLDLRYNRLSALEAGLFSALSALRVLNLAHNKLSVIGSGVFKGLTGLQRLDLSGNRLTTLPEAALRSTALLVNLNLGDNRLAKFPAKAQLPDGLQTLSILRNRLQCRPDLPKLVTMRAEKLPPCPAQVVAAVVRKDPPDSKVKSPPRSQRLAATATGSQRGPRGPHVIAPVWLFGWAISMTIAFALAISAFAFVLVSCLRHRKKALRATTNQQTVLLTEEQAT